MCELNEKELREQLKEARRLLEMHCAWCADCDWQTIPQEGLRETTEYTTAGNQFIRHSENVSCQFAQFWAKWKERHD